MQKKILITGGAGFIGSNFVHHLLAVKSAYEIVVLDKLTYAGNLENVRELIERKAIRFVQGDIADAKFISSFFDKESKSQKGFALVANFAAETHVDRSIKEPAIFVATNVTGTVNLLEACREFGVSRFHQISTDEVYGDLGDKSTNYFTEQTPLDPNCPYASSKAAADLLALSYYKTYGMAVTVSRCSNNYGPYQFPEKLIPYFFTLAQQSKPLPLYGDGKNVRDWLYVEDHCQAIRLILEKGRSGEVYNIGGHNEKTNREIAHLILKFLNKPQNLITYVKDRQAHDRRYAMDPKKIKHELGWKPLVHFEEGIERTFEWYTGNQTWWKMLVKREQRNVTLSPLCDTPSSLVKRG